MEISFINRFDERFNVTSVPFFTPDFDLLNCELDNFTFNPKTAWGWDEGFSLTLPCGFSKNISSKEQVEPWFL